MKAEKYPELRERNGVEIMEKKRLLVVSAHPADFVWRAGGTIASYIQKGHTVKIIVLSYGIRGECNDLWKQPGQTVESVKATRDAESRRAAAILGVTDIEYWDYEDYPFTYDRERMDRLTRAIREFRPDILLTHDKNDVLNPDHNAVSEMVFRCSVMSNSRGVQMEGTTVTKQMAIFGFEPHQTEISGYVPTMMIDITDSFDKKVEAMHCFKSQSHLIEYYTQRAFMRGNHARRLSGNQSYQYAESFHHFFPSVGEEFT